MPNNGLPGAQMNRQPKRTRLSTKPDGTACLVQEESWGPIGSPLAFSKLFAPGNSGLPRLDAVASLYDKYKLVSCVLEYRTVVGTVQSGEIVYGVDYNVNTSDTSYAAVVLMNDKAMTPIWQNSNVNVNINKAMEGKLWKNVSRVGSSVANFAEGPCFQVVVNTVSDPLAVVGRLWVRYKVEFTSPVQPGVDATPASITTGFVEQVGPSSTGYVNVVESDSEVSFPTDDTEAIPSPSFIPVQIVPQISGPETLLMNALVGPINSGTLLAIESTIPNITTYLALNATPQLRFVGFDGIDYTTNFRVLTQSVASGLGGYKYQRRVGVVPGVIIWAVEAIGPMVVDFFVETAIPLALEALGSWASSVALSVTTGTKALEIEDRGSTSTAAATANLAGDGLFMIAYAAEDNTHDAVLSLPFGVTLVSHTRTVVSTTATHTFTFSGVPFTAYGHVLAVINDVITGPTGSDIVGITGATKTVDIPMSGVTPSAATTYLRYDQPPNAVVPVPPFVATVQMSTTSTTRRVFAATFMGFTAAI